MLRGSLAFSAVPLFFRLSVGCCCLHMMLIDRCLPRNEPVFLFVCQACRACLSLPSFLSLPISYLSLSLFPDLAVCVSLSPSLSVPLFFFLFFFHKCISLSLLFSLFNPGLSLPWLCLAMPRHSLALCPDPHRRLQLIKHATYPQQRRPTKASFFFSGTGIPGTLLYGGF